MRDRLVETAYKAATQLHNGTSDPQLAHPQFFSDSIDSLGIVAFGMCIEPLPAVEAAQSRLTLAARL